MGFNTKIKLVDIETKQNPKTGKRKLKIVKETILYGDKQEVGLQEFYSAEGVKMQLVATFEIPANKYHNEKFLLTEHDSKQYQITRVGKGRSLAYLRLPVKSVEKNLLLEGYTSG